MILLERNIGRHPDLHSGPHIVCCENIGVMIERIPRLGALSRCRGPRISLIPPNFGDKMETQHNLNIYILIIYHFKHLSMLACTYIYPLKDIFLKFSRYANAYKRAKYDI